jgi:riboflavin biosynthesis pyrimidine reductase
MTSRASGPPRPLVICHMLASIDGRIVVGGWPAAAEGRRVVVALRGLAAA